MPVENLLQEYNQIATLAGILAGFAFSAVIQLLSVDKPGRLMTTVLVVFSVSAAMFLFTLFTFVIGSAVIAELNREVSELSSWVERRVCLDTPLCFTHQFLLIGY